MKHILLLSMAYLYNCKSLFCGGVDNDTSSVVGDSVAAEVRQNAV